MMLRSGSNCRRLHDRALSRSSGRGSFWDIWQSPRPTRSEVTHRRLAEVLTERPSWVDRSIGRPPAAGRDPSISPVAITRLVALACQKPKELGYSHELWTTQRVRKD
jgi:hypothetical protein